ncbi:MAG: hypothetical protein ACK5LY_03535, partial [Lachnospirales bacterium]
SELLKVIFDVERSHKKNLIGLENLKGELTDKEIKFAKTTATEYPDNARYNLCNNKELLFKIEENKE